MNLEVPTVFYSWQSDLPAPITRSLIREAAGSAVSQIVRGEMEDAVRLDSDTRGVAGAPDIAATIFSKVESCAVFLADVSFVAALSEDADRGAQKKCPNANVLIELGYAAHAIGWERIVLAMNAHFGGPYDLPFDLRHRRFPIQFDVPQTASPADRSKAIASLARALHDAFSQSLGAELARVGRAIARLDADCLRLLADVNGADTFSFPNEQTMRDVMKGMGIRHAVARLIDLDLISCDQNVGTRQNAYHWTYLGRAVLSKLGYQRS